MTEYDAIVIGAGHNGLTAATLLQRAGLRTLCLDSKAVRRRMASTVELFDGYKFENRRLSTDSDVGDGEPRNSDSTTAQRRPRRDVVSLRASADDPLVYYTRSDEADDHINEVHGAEASTAWQA